MDKTRRQLREYIKHLQKARAKIERKQDEQMSPIAAVPTTTTAEDSEIITLGVIIRDLEEIAFDPDFTYWDA